MRRWERDGENNHYYDHARKHDFNLGRFVSPDKVGGWSTDPQSWNRYTYAKGNPQKYVDPDGNLIDTVMDVAFIAYDLFDIGSSVISGERVTGSQLASLGADIGAAAIPFVTGAGAAVRAASHLDDGARVAGKLDGLGLKLKNIFTKNLTDATVQAAAKETKGQVVARKATGEAFDHAAKYEQARRGATGAIDDLKKTLQRTDLSPAQRKEAQGLLSKYSKQLDEVERKFQRAYVDN